MTTGDKIVQLRESHGLTQTDLATKTRINRSVLNRIELGTRPLRDSELLILANFFNVSTDYLLGKTNIPNATILSAVPSNAAPIDGLIGELFADRPDVLALLKNGVYDDGGKYRGKKLSDLSDVAKKHLRDTIISILELSGYLQPKS